MKYNTFLVSGFGRSVRINWIWRSKSRAMDRAYSRMTDQEYDDDGERVYGCVSKSKGRDVFHVALSGVGHSLFDTIIHEACHVGQMVSKNREIAAELTARIAGTIVYNLRLDNRTKLK